VETSIQGKLHLGRTRTIDPHGTSRGVAHPFEKSWIGIGFDGVEGANSGQTTGPEVVLALEGGAGDKDASTVGGQGWYTGITNKV